jgi:hypothetical protein
VSGVRFYKGANDTGTHTGSLWNVQSSGQTFAERSKVATATFSGETSSGWQQVNFATPQLLIPNQLYIVSYNSPTGNTAIEANGYYSAATAQWAFQNGTVVASSGAGTTGTGFPTGKGMNLRLVDPVLSVNANGANPFTLFGNSGPPGQQLRLYVVDWYTGLSDAQWSILSGPGTIQNGVDQFGVPCALYTAPSTQPTPGTGVVIQAQSASNPSITATTHLSFTGSEWSVK